MAPAKTTRTTRQTTLPTSSDCETWRQKPSVNPMTGRTISLNGMQKTLRERCDLLDHMTKERCHAFGSSTIKRHPLTGRKVNATARHGLFATITAICTALTEKTTDKTDHYRALITALQKQLKPLFHRDSLEQRQAFARIVSQHIRKREIRPCFEEVRGRLVLLDKNAEPTITFDRQIGSTSLRGVAYLNTSTGFGRLLKFSCKITGSPVEAALLLKLSNIVMQGRFPNYPITYAVKKCDTLCEFTSCPQVTRAKNYWIIMNEIASYDIQQWFKWAHTDGEYESVIMQLLLTLENFHSRGFAHNDMHLGNGLIHVVEPGGFWHYKTPQGSIYVPNKGYLLTLWDFDTVTTSSDVNSTDLHRSQCLDLYRPIHLMFNMSTTDYYATMNLRPIPDRLRRSLLQPFYSDIRDIWLDLQRDGRVAPSILPSILKNKAVWRHVIIETGAVGLNVEKMKIINTVPYSVR